MGYGVKYEINDVVIPEKSVPDCLAAINALHLDLHYAWVGDPPAGGFKTLVEAFRAWRFSATDNDSDIVLEYFNGEKLGDEECLFRAIAPYVIQEEDPSIFALGEDGTQWRYLFNGRKLIEQRAHIEWR